MKIVKVEINFPVAVEFPDGWDLTLDALVDMVCKKYEAAHPDRTMWPAGAGSKILWREPQEPDFDDSVYSIDAEREASDKEISRRATAPPTKAPAK